MSVAEEPPVCVDADVEGAGVPFAGEDVRWKKALDRVVPCCVVLKVTQTRAFDTEAATSAYATGFIVDKQRGLLLTNRHVVTPGPIVAEAIFLNREELPVYPLYYDPVHDFAFLRFDPGRLQFMEVNEVPLAPEAAVVGLDIRVVGNDSGEKVSILAGTLARLDRDAPTYGRRAFNDFNTFYLQAASGTKGGSSGSPVIDCQGRAVGLNAGGKNKAASAYYLPLERVVRALQLIQASKDVTAPVHVWPKPVIPRGDLQTTFLFKGFDEVRRLGLRQETERRVRTSNTVPGAPNGELRTTGMLVVDSVVPGTPADGVIEAGDVLCCVNGQVVTHFLTLEEVLDSAVEAQAAAAAAAAAAGGEAAAAPEAKAPGTVELQLERGGQTITATLAVTDLHSVTPSSFLELAGGSVHGLSYQQARNNRAVVGQVYVSEPGYLLGRANVPKFAIITALAGKPTPGLEAFAAVLRTLPHGARTPLEFYTFGERHRRKNAILHVDRQWYGPPVLWERDDAAGVWHPTVDVSPPAPLPAPASGQAANGKGAAAALPAASTASAAAARGSGPQPAEATAEGGGKAAAPGSNSAAFGSSAQRPANGTAAPAQEASVGSYYHGGRSGTAAAAAAAAAEDADRHTANGTAASGVLRHGAMELDGEAEAGDGGGEEEVADVGVADAGAEVVGGRADGQVEAQSNDLDEVMRCCLVLVDVDIPLVALSDGVHARSFAGNGLVVYMSERVGLVLVDRNTVVVGPCDVNLSFGAHPAEVPARVRFLHPLHNFALASFDPAALPPEARAKVRAAELLSSPPLKRGEVVQLVGLTKHLRVMQRTSTVINATAALNLGAAEVPRFRAVHEEVIKLDQDFGATFSGCLTDTRGRVRALWGSYAEQVEKEEREWCAGLHTHVFLPWVQLVARQLAEAGTPAVDAAPPGVCVLDSELEAVLLSKAAQFGLPGDWVSRLDRLDPERRQVLRVRSCVAQSHAAQVLRGGDMILAVGGRPVTCFHDVERLVTDAAAAALVAAAAAGRGVAAGKAAAVPAEAAGPNSSSGKAQQHGGSPPPRLQELPDMEMDEEGERRGGEDDRRPAKRVRNNNGGGPQGSTMTIEATAGGGAAVAARASPDGEVTGPSSVPLGGQSAPAVAAAPHTQAPAAQPPPQLGPGQDQQQQHVLAPDGSLRPVMPLTIFRGGSVVGVDVVLGREDGMGTGRLVHWCGAQLQAPHRGVRELGFLPAGAAGVYISRWHHGSPAHRYGLYALHWIQAVNGQDTHDLDSFLAAVQDCKDGDFVRIKVCHLETTQPKVLTMKLDLKYWPTWELALDPGTCSWHRRQISPFPHNS